MNQSSSPFSRVYPACPVDSAVDHLGVRVDPVRHRAFCGNNELQLTPTEFRLLEHFVRHPGRTFCREELIEAAIGDGAVVLVRTIDVHIKSLRRKLGPSDLIETVRCAGYRTRHAAA